MPKQDMTDFAFDRQLDTQTDIVAKYGYRGDVLGLFVDNKGPIVHTWHHSLPLWERHAARFRDSRLRFLDIGVREGGSLRMWRRHVGDDHRTGSSCQPFVSFAGCVVTK